MNINVKDHLNPKILHHCFSLFENEHYTECAHTAMKQVDINLNRKCGVYGFVPSARTIDKVFSSGKGIRLEVPLGEDQAEGAKLLFRGAFKYYRNYTAHNQENIDKVIAFRVMIIASELLDLLGCSTLDLKEIGGVDEIINLFQFEAEKSLDQLLIFIDGQYIIEDDSDGFFGELALNGFNYEQYGKLFDLNLVFCEEVPCKEKTNYFDSNYPEYLTYFKLTEMGHEVLKKISSMV